MTAPRKHGTRARYVQGPDQQDVPGRPCRCPECREANRAYASGQERQALYGRWRPYVDAGPARRHLQVLAAAGIGWRRAAALSGLSTGAVSRILRGGPAGRAPTRRIRGETERKILAVQPAAGNLAPRALTDATAARRRLQALVARGYSQAFLAARLGITLRNFIAMLARGSVTAATDRAVALLYDELWDVPPDESTHRSRISASRARNHAAARGWPPPMAWDDATIADPAATPAEGWRRPSRLSNSDLVEEAAELIAWEGSRELAAARLGVSHSTLNTAITRSKKKAS